jgi:hypothetical protein
MSDQAAGQPGPEHGSLDFGASAPEPSISESSISEPAMSEPSIAEPAFEVPKAEAVAAEPVAAKPGAHDRQAETSSEKISSLPGKVIVMSRDERAWTDHGIHAEPEAAEPRAGVFGKRRIAAIAAVLALATAAGAAGGALATASLMHGTGIVASDAGSASSSLEASLSRIDGDIQSLKSGLDHTSKLGMTQFNKTAERLDKLEHAQAEPAAKLAKLSEAIDRLHALPVPPPAVAVAAPAASAASKEATGSIPATPSQQVASATPAAAAAKNDTKADTKTEVGRLPTLDGWILRDVGYGGALIDGRRGTYEVYAGDVIPGLGRVDAIRRQDGRWVVVTSRGLIVAR